MTAGALGAAAIGGVAGYSYWESGNLEIRTLSVALKGLPAGFKGCRVALLTDLHHSFFISREYIEKAVSLTNSLDPDIILLAGDYINDDAAYIVPVMEELHKLHAPLGVFAVQGNRDIRVNRMLVSRELARNGIRELTNKGCWIERGGSRIWLCGMDDFTLGHPDAKAALKGASDGATILALTHNPHFADFLEDPRIMLVLSGHTHGGQINLPFLGRPFIPKGCGNYPAGLAQAPHTKVFVSVGVGSVFPPLRLGCPPEVALLTLESDN